MPGVDSPWTDWGAASRTLHYCAEDPLLDWLDLYGEAHGFARDEQRPTYDARTDFRQFIFQKARKFESVVVTELARRYQVQTICTDRGHIRDRAHVEATWNAMSAGVEIISQGTLWNPETSTYGSPDLLVRSDILRRIFPNCISDAEARHVAPDLPLPDAHYRVVDVKFTTLDLLKDRHAGADQLKYMVQISLYNSALGRLQGFTPASGFLFGRRWTCLKDRGSNAFDRLARIDQNR